MQKETKERIASVKCKLKGYENNKKKQIKRKMFTQKWLNNKQTKYPMTTNLLNAQQQRKLAS